MTAALAGLAAYQAAPRPVASMPMPAIAEMYGASLRDYGGEGPPLLVIPSLINPPHVLDMPGRSLLRWLAARGSHVFLADWGEDVAARRHLSVAGHVEAILLPFIEAIGEPPRIAGYCLGGTMAVAAAALARARSVATLAAPWRFAGFPENARADIARLWHAARPAAEALGLLPMEVLQSGFWRLDPARTVAKFERFATLDPAGEEAAAFVALEDWANQGPPIGLPAAREMFEDLFAADHTGRGEWRVGARAIDPAALPCPLLNIVSTTDRIVPAASAIDAGERIDLALGHVGMVVGGRAREALWHPLADWLSRDGAS